MYGEPNFHCFVLADDGGLPARSHPQKLAGRADDEQRTTAAAATTTNTVTETTTTNTTTTDGKEQEVRKYNIHVVWVSTPLGIGKIPTINGKVDGK